MVKIEILENEVSKRIYILRGTQVMLDSDLAESYKVKTGLLNEAAVMHLCVHRVRRCYVV